MGRRLIDASLMEEAERYAEERMQREDCRLFVAKYAELKGSVRRMFIARYLNGMLYEQSEQG